MPRLDRDLSAQAQSAVGIVQAGEIARISGTADIRDEWSVVRLEALHELAYLRVFAAWETCLEAVLCRSLCGYASAAGQEVLVNGGYYRTLAAAELAVLRGKNYALWSNPQVVVDRCNSFIMSGPGYPSIQANTITSKLALLNDLASTRHRIVHDQSDAKRKFDSATLNIAGRTYRSSRPGKFLRDWDPASVPARRWLDVTIHELTALAAQIV